MKPKVAVVVSGGTMVSVGAGKLDLLNYGATGIRLDALGLLGAVPEAGTFADLIPVDCGSTVSNDIAYPQWRDLHACCTGLTATHPDLAGIVVVHGTATLEETAYFLDLTLRVGVRVVLTGSQRPLSALSSDGPLNLVAAIRTAAAPHARGLGVLVVLNDEIHAARDVTKGATLRLDAFRSPGAGPLGHVDGDAVLLCRAPTWRHMSDTAFGAPLPGTLPRVDIAHSHAGADSTAVQAFVAAGAQGIVSAGFGPGLATSAETAALAEAAKAGVVVVQSSRVGSGRVADTLRVRRHGFVHAGGLNSQKARILLALALTMCREPPGVQAVFDTH